MLTIFSAIAIPSSGSLVGLIIWAAILAVAVWAIIALVKWSGVQIPQPVWIVLSALVAIFLILFIARIFGMAV